MKIYLISLIAIFCCSHFTAQESFQYKAVYDFTYQPDSTNTDSRKSETMLLYLGDKFSRFSSLGNMIKDSLSETIDKSNRSMAEFSRIRSMTPETDFDYKIFKDREAGELRFIEKIFKDKVRYSEDLKLQTWQIDPQNDTILGYQVQKASTIFAGRDYEAWFTPEIPIPDGPYKFNGLPGLILKINDSKNEYAFTLTGFQKLKTSSSPLKQIEDYRLVDKKDFLRLKENFQRDPLTAMSNAGVKIGWSKEQARNAKKELDEKFKKENNPIELE